MTRSELLLFGERIRQVRAKTPLTQDQVAEKIGISLRFYQMLECGSKRPSLATLIKLSSALNVSIDYLLLGNMSKSLHNPIDEIYSQLSPRQRNDATRILELYLAACHDSPQNP